MDKKIKVFGAALDVIDDPTKILAKCSYINRWVQNRIDPERNFLDPYEGLLKYSKVLQNEKFIKIGKFPVDSWITPKPNIEDYSLLHPLKYQEFVNNGAVRDISLNLTKFVDNPFTEECLFDFGKLEETVRIAIRFLDNVVDCTQMPLEKINDKVKGLRRLGLGFTGLGNAFAMMRIKYGSDESKELSKQIAEIIRDTSYSTSCALAFEKGTFPFYDKEILNSNFIKKLPKEIKANIKLHGLRNISMNTCAPTGTTSLTLGQNCSSGIEPTFALEYTRTYRTEGDKKEKENVYDYAWLKYQEYCDNNELNIKDVPDYFVTTADIDPYAAIDIQAIFQEYIDSSISKTINLPNNVSFDEYKNIFMYAYKKGLKGITSFNPQGSLKGILETNSDNREVDFVNRHDAPKRPKSLECKIHAAKVGDQHFTILVGLLNGSIYEVFVDDNHIDIQKFKDGVIQKISKG